jgi:hypothetical protein
LEDFNLYEVIIVVGFIFDDIILLVIDVFFSHFVDHCVTISACIFGEQENQILKWFILVFFELAILLDFEIDLSSWHPAEVVIKQPYLTSKGNLVC